MSEQKQTIPRIKMEPRKPNSPKFKTQAERDKQAETKEVKENA